MTEFNCPAKVGDNSCEGCAQLALASARHLASIYGSAGDDEKRSAMTIVGAHEALAVVEAELPLSCTTNRGVEDEETDVKITCPERRCRIKETVARVMHAQFGSLLL